MITKLLVILLSVLGLARAAPTATYDQRQDGDLNVKVDLDNFVILVARPSSSLDVFGSMAQLFADAKRASPVHQGHSAEQEGQEQKAITLELDKSKDLDNVSLDEVNSKEKEKEKEEPKEEMIVLVQEGEKAARSLEDIVRTLRNLKGKEAALAGEKDRANKGLSGKYKFVESVDEPQSLKLIGDAVENCGPGRSRDRLGICQAHK